MRVVVRARGGGGSLPMSVRGPSSDPRKSPRLDAGLTALVDGLGARMILTDFAAAAGALADLGDAALLPEEAPAAENMALVRRRAFASGRACARLALERLGRKPVGVGVGHAGAPIWPRGVVGSITHTDAWAAAVVADDRRALSLGLDLEDDAPLDAATCDLVCSGDQTAIESNPPPERLRLGKLVFTIKEAVYKCHWPIARRFLEFEDVRVRVDIERGTFHAHVAEAKAARLAGAGEIEGAFVRSGGLCLALAVLLRRA